MCLLESEASDCEDDSTEMWNEDVEEEIINDLELTDPVPPTDSQLDSASVQSQALSRWVLLFLMFIQATYKLSNTVVSVLLFLSCVSYRFWPV